MLQGLDPVMEGIVTDLEKVTDFSNLIKMNNTWFAKHRKAIDSSDSDNDAADPTGNDSDDDKPSIAATAAATKQSSNAGFLKRKRRDFSKVNHNCTLVI